jgi:hypothetical protein
MPLTLHVNISKKVGEPDYGSRGASVSLQQEVDSSLINQPAQLQAQINALFQQARTAVEAELFGREPTPGYSQNGTPPSNGNGHHRQTNGRRATDSQIRAIHAIANRQKLDLIQLLSQRFQVGRPEDLSISEASELIDQLKSEPARNGGGR